MDDQLDNDLRDRIREVFDNYEDTTADEGWLLLREKFPEQDRQRRPVYLWWASAAAVLLFLSIGLWMFTSKKVTPDNQTFSTTPAKQAKPQNNPADSAIKNAAPQNPAVNTPSPAVAPAQSIAANTPPPVSNTANSKKQSAAANTNSPSPAANPAQNSAANTLPPAANLASNSNKPAANKLNPVSGISVAQQNTVANNNNSPAGKPAANQAAVGVTVPPFTPVQAPPITANPVNAIAKNNGLPVSSPSKNNSTINALPLKKADSTKSVLPQDNTPQYAANPVTQSPVKTNNVPTNTAAAQTNAPASVVKVKPKITSMEALLASDDNKPKKPDNDLNERRVKFSVYAATFFNYAKGSQNQVNAGAGFTSDIKLSKNLKLSTGLLLAQNTLNYNKNQPSNVEAAVSFSPSLSSAYNSSVADFSKVSASPSFKNYNANLVGLDIPVNLKYEFNPQKNDTYVSAGLSSGTFINEAYTASYSYPGLAQAAGVQQTSDETTRKSFNSFYFAKTLNVAFGVGYALGKSNRIVIEPFLKYPLDGLGSQQIKFGAGGLNLKLNFTTNKK
jgi:hypothetical protein